MATHGMRWEVRQMQIQTLTFEQILVAIAVILLLVDIYNKIMTAVKNAREEKKRRNQPVNTLEDTVKDHTAKLKKDHERLTELEDSNRVIMRALMALLSHEISGNSDEKLKASLDEIQKFLIEK